MDVFIGCDMQGDDCIYITLGGEPSRYLSKDELQPIVDHLHEWLNAKDCPVQIDDSNVGDDLCDTCGASGVVVDHTHDGDTVCVECAKDCDLCDVDEADAEPLFRIGDRVEAGAEGTGEHDAGRILAINGDAAEVGWDSGTRTSISFEDLRGSK